MRRLEPVSRRHDHGEEFACPHCKTGYVVIWEQPGCDNGSAQCEICGNDMLRWRDSFIPIIKCKTQVPGIFAGGSEYLPRADGLSPTPRSLDRAENFHVPACAPALRKRAV
jgi:predicted Zn finger-like uncharacterized protein